MQRIVVLGRGGAGKSTLAERLERTTALPRTELDAVFWSAELEPTPRDDWRRTQADLATRERWILDGDLGPHDDLAPRLRRADTVIVLDLPAWRCARRVIRRGRETRDFWSWMLRWRRRDRPMILRAIDRHAPTATLVVLSSPAEIDRWIEQVSAAGD
ncbi:MAG: adenylate kinase [Actinomycetota bacterium]